MKYNWNLSNIQEAVSKADSYSETLRIMNIPTSGRNADTLKRKIEEYNINIDHFTFSKQYKNGSEHLKYKEASQYLKENSNIKPSKLKEKLLKEGIKQNICENPECPCKDGTWLYRRLVCQLHHINGDETDNRIENLIMLCPNCHSQTENFCGNSNKNPIKYYCKDCGAEISRRSTYCPKCAYIHAQKIERPSKEQLLNDFKELKSFTQVGNKYNVTDNAVRKWYNSYGIPNKSKELKEYINSL